MSADFDMGRIAELEEVMGTDARTIVASMLASMTSAIDEVETALAAGHLDRVTQAAHRCRNDALMLGARQLQESLTAIEAATRDHDTLRARKALTRLRAVWPSTREQLAEASRPQ
ncbi:MAG TPA: Hpt domain-containing protein [Solirubrobacteraceae bacterium]|jgi:HPt (histidine-containing phosphotransfer) domain-containing protein